MDWISGLLGRVHPALGVIRGLPLVVFLCVLALFGVFIIWYAVRWPKLWRQLKNAAHATRELKRKNPMPSKEDAAKAFADQPLKHIWSEYSETLHDLPVSSAESVQIVEIRATVPSEVFFSREALVDGRMFDEFFRHLPGILTGLGILGTFAGLLEGLAKFDPSSTARAVEGLQPLMDGVKHAFVASGIAIGCAMIVVFVSRFAMATLYQLVEELARAVDSLYLAGAGEAYLSKILKTSETQKAATLQLKDALVEDLRTMMTNLVDRQIQSYETATQSLGQRIGQDLAEIMKGPMDKISEGIESSTKGNGEQVSSMMESLLTAFMAKLEDTFGGQMRGINEQMQRSMDSMSAVQASLQTLLADIKSTNEHAASQMSGTLEDAMRKAADNQGILTDQMREFVQDFRRLVQDEQAKSQRTMDDAVSKVLGNVAQAMQNMEAMRVAAADGEVRRSEEISARTGQLVGGLSEQVDMLLRAITEQVTKTQQNIDTLGSVSTRAIEGMNQGALTMEGAARRFEGAGERMTGAFAQSIGAVEILTSTASSLQSAAGALRVGFEAYENSRRNVDAQVGALMGFIESAKTEAGVSRDLVDSMKASAEAMRLAEAESRQHLEQVNAALLNAFNEFGNQLVGAVRKTIAETDRHLSDGTGHLNGVVQEFAAAVRQMKRA